MTWVVPLALGGLAALVMAVFTAVGARKRYKAQVAPAKVTGPAVLIHDINDDRCTGCDACVAVCPTNVLDLVSNKSRVLRFQDCIQCEACMYACPTEALVMFPEGAVAPPLKCPEIDDNFQTIVPGQYLIGEVAGKPLVKSAANLGRVVVEHMLANGMRVGALGRTDTTVDVVIVGSGPGGLSAALTCVQRGLSYVVLEKEQTIASTIMRYPKGKLVMAEPYDTDNLSLLPIFDSSKEALIPIWEELIERVGLQVKLGESVETVTRAADGNFDIRTTVGSYRAQRVVLSIGTRGKPRTLQVPGENLPKIFSLLDDPDSWAGRAALVVGGGDSACEAALALADAGARVMISYRGKGFNRAAVKNKSAIERYAAEGRIKAKLGSQVLQFDHDTVTLALADGSQKKYPNDATFVLIGADPPIAWLDKLGVKFVERPHQYHSGKTDDLVRRLVPRAMECPEDSARAAAQVLGGAVGPAPVKLAAAAQAVMMPMPMGEPMSGPRKWLRSATSIFSNKLGTNPGIQSADRSRIERTGAPLNDGPAPRDRDGTGGGMVGVGAGAGSRKKKFDAPVPLSEFAKRQKSQVGHSGNGRRDQLSAGERTRILRMLRDEGGRIADVDSQVFIGAAPPAPNDPFDFDDSPAPVPVPRGPQSSMSPTPQRADIPAKPAVVVGLAQAKARSKRSSAERPVARPARRSAPPPNDSGVLVSSQSGRRLPLPADGGPSSQGTPGSRRSPLPPPFSEEPTRQVDDAMLAALRAAPAAGNPAPRTAPAMPDEKTRFGDHAPLNLDGLELDESTRPGDGVNAPLHLPTGLLDIDDRVEDHRVNDEATAMASLDGLAALERATASQSQQGIRRANGPSREAPRPRPPLAGGNEERTRAVDIRNDKSISDIDWDLD